MHPSYLDDPDHDWSLDTSEPSDLKTSLMDIFVREPDAAALDTIFRGYIGLRERHPEASAEQCLTTSLVWFYG